MSSLIYIEKIPVAERAAFAAGVANMATQLQCKNPNWFMQVFYSESKVNPKAVNPVTGATGLIQFMPATAKGLGTTTAALKGLTATQQLQWVYKYFAPYKGRLNSYFDVYCVVFFPAAVGKADNWVFKTSQLSAEVIAKQNPAINIIRDNVITVAEFKEYLKKTVPEKFRNLIFASAGVGAMLIIAAGILWIIAKN